MVKGFTRDHKFIPISDYNKVRNSSGKTIIPTGVMLERKARDPNDVFKRKHLAKVIPKLNNEQTSWIFDKVRFLELNDLKTYKEADDLEESFARPVGTARNKKKTFTSTSGQLLVLKGVEERPDHTQKTIDLLANLKRPKGLPETIGFKNVRDGLAEWTFFADGRYPFTRDGEIDVGRVRNAVARGSQQGVIDQLKRRGLCKVMVLSGIKVSIICKGLEA